MSLVKRYFCSIFLVAALCSSFGCKRSTARHEPTGGAQPPAHAHQPHANDAERFSDTERWAGVFEDPKRDEWQKPDEVISTLTLKPGMKVADVGAATGYFPVRIARKHPDITVYGVDLAPAMVEYLQARAEREALGNLKAVQGSADSPDLPEPVDLILLVDTYHHLHERPAYFGRVRERHLRPGGRIAIIDYRMDAPQGPPADHRIEPQKVIDELSRAGFKLLERHDFLPRQYLLIFE